MADVEPDSALVLRAVTGCAVAQGRWHNIHGGAITAGSVGFRRR